MVRCIEVGSCAKRQQWPLWCILRILVNVCECFPKTSLYWSREWYVTDAGLIDEIGWRNKLQKGTRHHVFFYWPAGFQRGFLPATYFTISIANKNPFKLVSATEQPLLLEKIFSDAQHAAFSPIPRSNPIIPTVSTSRLPLGAKMTTSQPDP